MIYIIAPVLRGLVIVRATVETARNTRDAVHGLIKYYTSSWEEV